MIYPHNFEQKIGFDQIRQLLKGKCLSTLGEERVDEMTFSDNYDEINQRLEQVVEFVRITQEEEDFPAQYFFDVRPSLKPFATLYDSFSNLTKKRKRKILLILPCANWREIF